MAGAAYISYRLGKLTEQELHDLLRILTSYGLPVSLKEFPYGAEEILAATKLDKKMESGKIKFIILNTLGQASITKELTDGEILGGISYILEKEKC